MMATRLLTLMLLLGLIVILVKLLFPYLNGEVLAPDVLATVVPALLVVIGWVGTFLLQEFRKASEQNEKRVDVQLAFRAEIWDFIQAYEYSNFESSGCEIKRLIVAGGDGNEKFVPFLPKEKVPLVFDSLSQNIETLPSATVNEVIQFYGQLSDLRTFAEDLRSPKLEQLASERRATAYGDYIDMKITAYKLAKKAHAILNKSLSIPAQLTPIREQQQMKGELTV